MSTITDIFSSASARDASKPASSNTGLVIFRSDTKAIEVSDGTDYYKYNNDGVSVPATTYLTFNGTTQYVDIPDDTAIGFSGDISISCWFKWDGAASSVYDSIVGKRDAGGTNYVLYINDNKLKSYDGSNIRSDST